MAFLDTPIVSTQVVSADQLSGSVQSSPVGSRARPYVRYYKQLFDIVLVVLVLPIVIPLLVVLAVLVALDGGNPIYSQKRIGRAGRIFRIWKLRTMVPNADLYLAKYLAENPEARAEWSVKQKLTDDPRITLVGRVLRKTSLDELPQLFNVLKGDMSLIGPRPMMIDQKPLYPGRAYFALRPGITGLWQVSDRNSSSFATRAQYDVAYYRSVSFTGDLRLLVATLFVMLRGTGC